MSSRKFSRKVILIVLVIYSLCLGVEWMILNSSLDQHLIGNKRFINLREPNPLMRFKSTKTGNQINVDVDGFIEPSKIHAEADFEIVFLGGSTTACAAVTDSLRFPYLTGIILEDKTHFKINSFNAGRSGNDAVDSYIRLLNVIIPKNPDYVILMHNINDILGILYTGSYWSDLNKNRLKVSSFAGFEKSVLGKNLRNSESNIFPNTQLAFQGILHKFQKNNSIDEWNGIRNTKIEIDTTLLYQDFESALNSFIHTCKEWNIEPILMTQQNRISIIDSAVINEQKSIELKLKNRTTFKNFQSIYSKANEIIRKISYENKVLLIDLDRAIPKEKEYIFDAVHLSTKGSELAATVISDSLFKHLPLKLKKQDLVYE